MKVIFFGTPSFAATILEYLLKRDIPIVAVISKPDKPKGRSGTPVPTPVKQVILDLNSSIPVFQPEIVSTPEFEDLLRSFNADLFIVVAYGEILKQSLLEIPRQGCINLHTSLLPKYRGAAPIQRAIIHGEKETGITLMHMAKKMDAGDIISQIKIPIGTDTNFGELESSLCEISKVALFDLIQLFKTSEPTRTPQDHSLATFAPKIELEDCEIHWKLPAQELHNLVRGVYPYPGAWCNVSVRGENKRLKINKTKIIFSEPNPPGTILNRDLTKGNLIVSTGHDALELLEVQLEGKKIMSSDELSRGIPRLQIHF